MDLDDNLAYWLVVVFSRDMMNDMVNITHLASSLRPHGDMSRCTINPP
jgi:hypothetical protein